MIFISGTPEGALSSKDYYSIDGNGFEILTSSWYDTNHGLFEFTLTSTDEQKQLNLKEYEKIYAKLLIQSMVDLFKVNYRNKRSNY